MKRELYPANWEEISHRIRTERAENKCEWCGVANHAYGYRDEAGNFVEVSQAGQDARVDLVTESGQLLLDCVPVHPQYKKLFRIMLTVAHLGADKPDGSPGDKRISETAGKRT
jgi:CRISPR/Cas system-associated protein Cas10 (large subunit of type III CRISPR-Cas system)